MNSTPIWTTPAGFLTTATELISSSITVEASSSVTPNDNIIVINATNDKLIVNQNGEFLITTVYNIITEQAFISTNSYDDILIVDGSNNALVTNIYVADIPSVVQYTVVSGSLPAGLTLLKNGVISGIPDAVINTTRSKFVVRATTDNAIADRTFYIDIVGANIPTWITDVKNNYLPVGVNGEMYALNNQYVQYQLSASATKAPTNTALKYYIADNHGKLPPGLVLSQSGIISGIITDKLTTNSADRISGGYDLTGYDTYSYDYALAAGTSISGAAAAGKSKVYQFKITATDGVSNSVKLFKILVTSIDILNLNIDAMPLDVDIPTPVKTIQSLQWLIDSDLGTVRASNNEYISMAAYDPAPLVGTVSYTILENVDIFKRLPEGLTIDTKLGAIYGFIPYQPAYSVQYELQVSATKTLNTSTSVIYKTFLLKVKGEVESTIEWVSGADLGSIDIGVTSELAVVAKQLQSNYSIKYQLINGSLPKGLTLARDGSIAGKVVYGNDGAYTFTIRAGDVYGSSAIEKTFNMVVTNYNDKKYTEMYFRPFLSQGKRDIYQSFISNQFTFDPALMYRYYDSNFGVQPNIKMVLEFGIEQLPLDDYMPALSKAFYRKRFYFGEVKVAVAKDASGKVVYEVVYVDVVDDMTNVNGTSLPTSVIINDNVYYPGSIQNMRNQLKLIVLADNTPISINEYSRPKYMLTAQTAGNNFASYIRAIPLCYALPGQGARVVSRIKISGFDFKQLDFEIDRLIVESSIDNPTPRYLMFAKHSISDGT